MVHEKTIQAAHAQLKELFDASDQALYIYLDDVNKVCNSNFSSMLGYDSPEAWADVKESFPTAFVAEGSQNALVGAYQDAMQKAIASHVEIEWKRKDSGTVKTSVILVPIEVQSQRMALHFIEELTE